ncbi:MAG: N-formylglutamate deformylase, partial [Gammaproteobacteria bacterium]
MSDVVEVTRGDSALLVSIPHTGTKIPPEIERDLVSPWLALKDTDWRIEQLYDFAGEFGATILRATHSRTVIDVNRDPSGASLYPGQTTTNLCPTETFDGEPLYKPGRGPNKMEVARRRELYFQPYHSALTREITRLKEKHRRIVLYDCHSIRSVVPRLFDGELPHMNIGTNSGATCDSGFTHVIQAVCDASGFSWSSNARFKG